MTRISQKVASTDDVEVESVYIPKWDVTIEVRGMSALDRASYVSRIVSANESDDPQDFARVQAELIVTTAYDPEDGSKAFEESDVDMLIHKSGFATGLLSNAAMRVSGLDKEAEQRLGKPSSASETSTQDASPTASTPSDASTSLSPANSA